MLKKIGWLIAVLTVSFCCVAGMPGQASSTPGTFVFSTQSDEKTINNWAENGFLLQELRFDYYNNGTVDMIYYYTFDAADRVVKLEIDYDSDDTIDEADSYLYNAAGNIYRVDIDSDNSGTVDAVIRYYFNDDNTISYKESDLDNDGISEDRITYVYQAGQLYQTLTDDNRDGQTDSASFYLWSDDFWVSKQTDSDNDGIGDYREQYSYNIVSGDISLISVDEDYDGVDDYASGFFYDDEGRLETNKTDSDNDGYFDLVKTYVWVAGGANDDDSSTSASCFLNGLTR